LNWGVSLATPLVRMASPRPPRCRQGVGGTPHERKADACAGKNAPPPCARRGKGGKSPAYTPARGPPHRCSAGRERERGGKREEGGGRENRAATWNPAARAGIQLLLLHPPSARPPIQLVCSARPLIQLLHGLCSARRPSVRPSAIEARADLCSARRPVRRLTPADRRPRSAALRLQHLLPIEASACRSTPPTSAALPPHRFVADSFLCSASLLEPRGMSLPSGPPPSVLPSRPWVLGLGYTLVVLLSAYMLLVAGCNVLCSMLCSAYYLD